MKAWREEGRHLPAILRDFHDQKAVFRAMHELQVAAGGASHWIREPSWVEGHWLEDTLCAVRVRQNQAFTQLLTAAAKGEDSVSEK